MFGAHEHTKKTTDFTCKEISEDEARFTNSILARQNIYQINSNNKSITIELEPAIIPDYSDQLLDALVLINGYQVNILAHLKDLIPWLPPPCNVIMEDSPIGLITTALELTLNQSMDGLVALDITDFKLIDLRINTEKILKEKERKNALKIKLTREQLSSLNLYVEKSDNLYGLIVNLPRYAYPYYPTLPLTINIASGAAVLTVEEFLDINADDIIILSEYYPQNNQLQLYLEYNTYLGIATYNHGNILELTSEEILMANKSENSILRQNLSNTEVFLRFDIGNVRLPLSEVLSIRKGHVFNLERDEAAPVDIIVNGAKIAECQLVSISGKIGAKIIRSDIAAFKNQALNVKSNTTQEEYHERGSQQRSYDPPVLADDEY